MTNKLKLHLGSGPVSLDGWVNIDLDAPEADMLLDLRRPLPFTDHSVSHVFSEHVLEHIEYDEALALLKEIKRVLIPEGVVRLTTPDLAWLVLNYVGAIADGWGDLWQPGTPAQLINQGMRYWGHCFIYDRPEMLRLLNDAGFGDVQFVSWGVSDDSLLCGIESRPYNREIIVEARCMSGAARDHSSEAFRSGYAEGLEELLAAQGAKLELADISARSHESALSAQHDEMRALAENSKLAAVSLQAELDAVRLESAERAKQLLVVEEANREAGQGMARLRSSIADAVAEAARGQLESREHEANLGALREREQEVARLLAVIADRETALQRVELALSEAIRESEARANHIESLTASLNSVEAYLERLRASLPGKLLLRAAKRSSSV